LFSVSSIQKHWGRITMNARVCGASAVLALTECAHVGVPEPVNSLAG